MPYKCSTNSLVRTASEPLIVDMDSAGQLSIATRAGYDLSGQSNGRYYCSEYVITLGWLDLALRQLLTSFFLAVTADGSHSHLD